MWSLYYYSLGGADKNAVVFHKDTEQVVATLKGHSKKVTDVLYHPRAVSNAAITLWLLTLSPLSVAAIRMWLLLHHLILLFEYGVLLTALVLKPSGYAVIIIISSLLSFPQSHSGPVTGISLHPTGDYLLTCSLDEVCCAVSHIIVITTH